MKTFAAPNRLVQASLLLAGICLLFTAIAMFGVGHTGNTSFGSAKMVAKKKSDRRNGTVKDTKPGLKKAKWGSNVTVSYPDGYIRYRSNGIPNHARQAQYAVGTAGTAIPTAATSTAVDDPTTSQSYDFKIPTRPTKAASKTSTSLGTIGVMISGAALFNPYEGDGTTVATASNFTVKNAQGEDVAFLDSCSGHPVPMSGMYHYHALPSCVTSQVDKPKGRSHMIGIAFDGYPIYGDRDINGRKIVAAQLDKCNGITSYVPEYKKRIYHYVLLDSATSRSSIRCFSGEVDSSLVTGMDGPGMGGGPMPGAPAMVGFYCPLGVAGHKGLSAA